jgi:hypothetical protein
MTTSIARPASAGTDLSTMRSARRRRIGTLVVLGLLVLAVAAAITWTGVQATRHPASGGVNGGTTRSGLVPGGSVYDEQVPATARWVNPYRPGSPYAVGGSVYDEQVPAAVRAGTP